MRDFLYPVMTILWKDVLLETRSKDIVVSVLVFALLVIVVFNFAVSPTPQTVTFVAPGILWIAITFGGVLGLNRSFALEKEGGNIHGLMSAPVGRDVIFFGKMLSIFLFMLVVDSGVESRLAWSSGARRSVATCSASGKLSSSASGSTASTAYPSTLANRASARAAGAIPKTSNRGAGNMGSI